MSGAQTSSFYPVNQLLQDNAQQISNQYAPQRNELFVQRAQQEIGAADIDAVSRASAAILGLKPEERPAAYQAALRDLQPRGFARNASPEYPGDATIERLAGMGMSVENQFKLRGAQNTPDVYGIGGPQPGAGQGAAPQAAPAVPIPPRGTGGPGGSVAMPPEYLNYFREASAETGIPMELLIAQARQESGFRMDRPGTAGEIGIFQIKPSTARDPGGMSGVDPGTLTDARQNILFGARYLKSRMRGDPNNPAVQAAALAAYNGGGDKDYVAHVNQYRPGMSPTDPGAAVTTYTPGGAPATATAAAPGRPVIIGDSIASPAGLGGTGTVGAAPAAVLADVQRGVTSGAFRGQPVVLSTGASNNPADLGSVEQQLQALKGSGASGVTVMGVGPAVEAKAPGTNAKLAALAQQNGATFVPLPADQMSPDGVHPTAQGYATVRGAIAAPQAGGGVAARTGGTDVAGPAGTVPGATTATAAPAAMPAELQTDGHGLTPQDRQELAPVFARVKAGQVPYETYLTDVHQRQTFNAARQDKWQAQQTAAQQHAQTQANAAATQAREQERLRIAQEEAEAKPDRVLARYADKIINDTATHEERQLYSLAAQHYLKPTMTWGDDPTDPSRKVMVQIPGQMPSGFPHPDFKPGQQPQSPPTATKAPDVKPLPEAERKVLLDTAGRLDQVSEQVNTFKPDYAGFTNAAVGDLANTAARNLPASKLATDRANWWSDYQRYKLAVRQGISGQSLTASEMSEFDKADINPGMTPEVVKRNLEHQASVLRTSHERRVASLAADKYSPDAIRAASGLDPAKVTSRPVGAPDVSQPQKTSLPPGWTVKIP